MSDSEREKKGGGAALPWMSGASRVPQSAAVRLAETIAKLGGMTGRAGIGQAAAMHAKLLGMAKVGLALMTVVGAGVGGYGIYDMGRRGGFGVDKNAPKSSQLFMPRPPSEDVNLERGVFAGGGQSALTMAHDANKGAFGAPTVDAAADAGAVKDDEFKDANAEGEGKAAAPGTPDAAAMAAQMAGAMGGDAKAEGKSAKDGLGHKFGGLSAGTGGGGTTASLSGGPGMSGGIGGAGFKKPLSNSKLSALSKGRAAQMNRSKTAAGQGKKLGVRSATGNKLSKMSGAMASANTNPDAAAATHSQQWDNAGDPGQGITGAGAGGIGDGGGFGADEGGSNGGPTDTGSTSSGNTGNDSSGSDVPDVPDSGNMTPYQALVDLAVMIHFMVTILLLVIWIASLLGDTPFTAFMKAYGLMILKIVIALSILETLCGVGIMMMGQSAQGGLFTAMGGITAIMAWIAYAGAEQSAEYCATTSAWASGLGALVQGAMGASVFSTGDHTPFEDDSGDDSDS
ncbi:MAG: hypothetical protein A2X36_14060 [Elusimicrobia bacterium GWA2_69_24]|nr:MAG: hypothetical protein A2X36_14060 [Elusimicrobia bacterium GWA2_69_24]HBL17291.1 hypothetical protein [Elusimicrobiota bacterium]